MNIPLSTLQYTLLWREYQDKPKKKRVYIRILYSYRLYSKQLFNYFLHPKVLIVVLLCNPSSSFSLCSKSFAIKVLSLRLCFFLFRLWIFLNLRRHMRTQHIYSFLCIFLELEGNWPKLWPLKINQIVFCIDGKVLTGPWWRLSDAGTNALLCCVWYQ